MYFIYNNGRVCACDSVSARGNSMGKKTVLFFAIVFFSCLFVFADGTSFGFGIVWEHTNVAYSTLTILDATGDSLPLDSEGHSLKTLSEVLNTQTVAILRYVTNVLGTHRLEYRATPLTLRTDSTIKTGYTLSFRIGDVNDNTAATLVVGTEADYYQSVQTENSTSITYLTIDSIAGNATRDIFVHLDIADADSMIPGDWVANLIITGVAP